MKHSPQFVRLARVPAQLVVILSIALWAPAWAQESSAAGSSSRISREGSNWSQEITGSLSGTVKNLRVKVDMGSVVVRGGQAQGVNYVIHSRSYTSSEQDARRQFENYKINAYVRGDTAWIVGDWEGKRPHRFSGEFSINVPRELALVKIETEGGNVEATGVSGRVEAQSAGGSMHLDDIGGGVTAETGGGSIEIGTTGGELGLHTGGGSIQVRQANGKVIAETGGGSIDIQSGAQGAVVETGGGSIQVRQCTGKLKVSTGGGSVDLGDIAGPVDVSTGGGSIHLSSAKGHVHAQTGGGGIELYGVPSARAETGAGGIVVKLVNNGGERRDSDLETSAGDITVYIASDVAISIRASVDVANGHRITSDFPEIRVTSEGAQWGAKTLSAEGSLNGGGPMLKVRTTTGDVCIRRMNH